MVNRILCALVGVCLAAGAAADVYVVADRTTVQVNESFRIELVADGGETGEPEVTGLDADFDVLGRSQSNNLSIINGRRESSRRWIYTLLPRATGTFAIPALSVGGTSSEPIEITVRPAVKPPPGEADVFVEATLDRDASWVQAQVIYTIKIYLGVTARQIALQNPVIEGGEVLIERLGEDRRYEALVGQRQYDVLERTFALFPQSSGEFVVEPAVFTASLWQRGRISSPRVFRSDALQLAVAPAVPPPPHLAGSDWLPARAVTLRAELRPADGVLDEGEPANLTVDLQAEGLLASQLPELDLALDPALRVYPDQPDLVKRALPGGVRASRRQGYAVIASRGGVFDLPRLELPWFDVDLGEWRVASAPLTALRAAGQVNAEPEPAPPPEVAPATEAATEEAREDAPDPRAESRLLRLRVTNYLLLGAWLITLYILWRGPQLRRRQRRAARREAQQNAPYVSARRALKAAGRAADAGAATEARDALLTWARETWPAHPPGGLAALARYLPAETAAPVLDLHRHLYGPSDTAWDGAALRAQLSALDRAGTKIAVAPGPDAPLPPLIPAR